MTTYPVALHRSNLSLIVPIVTFLVGLMLALAFAVATGWGSAAEDRPQQFTPTNASVDQPLDCRMGRAC